MIVLFTGGGGAATEALYRLLKRDHHVMFADADPRAMNPTVPAGHSVVLPRADSSDYISALARLCREHSIDVVVPGVDEELLPIACNRDKIPAEVLLPDETFVRRNLDKAQSMAALTAKGLPCPKTDSIHVLSNCSFPVLLKPISGRGSRNVRVVHNLAEAQAHVLLSGLPAEAFIVQEYIKGVEYTVFVQADKWKRLKAIVPVQVEVKKGITLRARIHYHPSVLSACELIHEALPTYGVYNIQLILTDDGRVLPFEINPRISTTTCLAVAAGIDLIRNHYDDAGSLCAQVPALGLQRYWMNYFKE
jgi:carbamoyl-phosphate synthase large subunit